MDDLRVYSYYDHQIAHGITPNEFQNGSTQKPKEEAQVTPQPHPCKECNKYGCDVHCPFYGK